jgi:hypothetical protein
VTERSCIFPRPQSSHTSLQIGEPLQLAGRYPQPFRKRANRLDGRNRPRSRHMHWLHAAEFANPLRYSNLLAVMPKSSGNTFIALQKQDKCSASRPGPRSEFCQITSNKRLDPPPFAAERPGKARAHILGLRFARKHRIRQCLVKRGATHNCLQQSAPTSLALRDLLCAAAQRRSHDEFPVIHVAPG